MRLNHKLRRQLAASLCVSCLTATTLTRGQDRLDDEEWQEDLTVLVDAVRDLHADPFHTIGQLDFDRAVARLRQQIPSLPGFQILTEMKRLVAAIGDGHTALRGGADLLSGYYPFRLYVFEDGLHVQAAASRYPRAVGARVVAVNGTPADEVLDAALSVTHGDNSMSKRQFVSELLTVPELLWGLGIVPAYQDARFELVNSENRRLTIVPQPVAFDSRVEWVNAREATRSAMPLYLSHLDSRFWSEYLADARTLYVQLNSVRDGREQTVSDFFDGVLEFVDANPVDRFVLDLRFNGGGNKRLNPLLIEKFAARSSFHEPGNLFVLIGRGTFSAAVHLATQIEAQTGAIFVGEPTGGRPNHYGDSDSVRLPHSGLEVTPATIYWEDSTPFDNRPWIEPDVPVLLRATDYRAGRDPVLEAVLAYGEASP